jgi:hypothetical protein
VDEFSLNIFCVCIFFHFDDLDGAVRLCSDLLFKKFVMPYTNDSVPGLSFRIRKNTPELRAHGLQFEISRSWNF